MVDVILSPLQVFARLKQESHGVDIPAILTFQMRKLSLNLSHLPWVITAGKLLSWGSEPGIWTANLPFESSRVPVPWLTGELPT